MACLLDPKIRSKHVKMDLQNRLAPQDAPASFLRRFRLPNCGSKSTPITKTMKTHFFSKQHVFLGCFFNGFRHQMLPECYPKRVPKRNVFAGQAENEKLRFDFAGASGSRDPPIDPSKCIKTNCEPTRLEGQPRSFIFSGFWSARWTSGNSKTKEYGVASRFFFPHFV